jgi:DNA helicase-2/ATP-dependent DNA helicase PcrA
VKPTGEQQAILTEAVIGKGDLLIDALAGTGKTSTLLEILKVIPQRSVLVAAFNRGISDEFKTRMPPIRRGHAVVVQTLHSIGRAIIVSHFPKIQVDRDATEALISSLGTGAPYEVRRSAVRLVRCAKETLAWSPEIGGPILGDTWPADVLLRLGFDQRLFSGKLKANQIERAVDIARRAVAAGLDMTHRKTIDFCDMVWLPTALDLAPRSRFKAIMLDEVQDTSKPQLDLLARVALPDTRYIACGDEWQQIYSWRGSLGGAVWSYFKATKRFPLTMTWRCSTAIVKAANALVPALKARPDADEGEVSACTIGELPLVIAQGHSEGIHTFVLSRNNAALLDCALFLWRAGTRFQLYAGDEMLEPLFSLIDSDLDLRSTQLFTASLSQWHARETMKADQAGSTSRHEQVDEIRKMLMAALNYTEPNGLKRLLSTILADTKSGVLLSTVHRVKGREAERVFLLRKTFARHNVVCQIALYQPQRGGPPIHKEWTAGAPDGETAALFVDQEELNIEYVAITRARTHLVWVDVEDQDQPELLTIAVNEIGADDLDAAYSLAERAMQQAEGAGDQVAAVGFAERSRGLWQRLQKKR